MKPAIRPLQRRAFILRIWEEGEQVPVVNRLWRCSLLDVGNGERILFAGLDRLIDYLRALAAWQETEAPFTGPGPSIEKAYDPADSIISINGDM